MTTLKTEKDAELESLYEIYLSNEADQTNPSVSSFDGKPLKTFTEWSKKYMEMVKS